MWLQDIRALRAGPERIGSAFSDLLVAETGDGGAALYATSARYGGMGVWELRAGATAQLVDAVAYPATTTLGASGQLTLSADGSMLAYGVLAGQLEAYARHLDGKLAQTVSLGGIGLGTERTVALHWTSLADGEAVYVAGSQGLALFRAVDGGTRLEQAASGQTGGGAPPLASTAALTETTVGGARLLLAADSALDELRVYRMDTGTGALTLTDTAGAADGLGIADPKALATVAAHGQSWAILGANGTGSISVLRVDANGQIEAVDHVLDTRDTRFGMLQDLVAFTIGAQAFVLAAGADGGASLFALPPDGRLVHLETLEHSLQRPFPDVAALAVGGLGGDLAIFAAGGGGLVQIDLPTDTVGLARQAPAGASRIEGGPGGDLLSAAGPGADTLVGRDGNDILVGGPGGGVMEGGGGADVFVIRPAEAPTRITDFTPGEDRLDLSALPMLRNDRQIDLQSRQDGALLRYRDQEIILRSAEGDPLAREDLFARGIGAVDRVLVLGGLRSDEPGTGPVDDSPQEGDTDDGTASRDDGTNQPAESDAGEVVTGGPGPDTATGGGDDDSLPGGDDSDTISGAPGDDALGGGGGAEVVEAGDDTTSGDDGTNQPADSVAGQVVTGGPGPDTVFGGGGDDRLSGGGGDDRLWAGGGNDTIYGGTGHDALGGGPGADVIWAGDGKDTVYGGTGHDALGGGPGADEVWAGDGNDTIYGGTGHDALGGGPGADEVWAGGGNDTIYGGTGHDALGGGPGADAVWAGDGNDTVDGGTGDDTLGGGPGADVIWAGNGNDTVDGGTGDDTLHGNEGDDRLSGEAGADTFVFRDGWGHDTVTDFDPAEGDLLDLRGWRGVDSFDDLLIDHLGAEGDNALLFASADSLLLIGIGVEDLGWGREINDTDILF